MKGYVTWSWIAWMCIFMLPTREATQSLNHFIKTLFWNFQKCKADLCYILIDKQMLEKVFCSNIAPSLSSRKLKKKVFMNRSSGHRKVCQGGRCDGWAAGATRRRPPPCRGGFFRRRILVRWYGGGRGLGRQKIGKGGGLQGARVFFHKTLIALTYTQSGKKCGVGSQRTCSHFFGS